jgi:hypothetical protein
MSPEGAHARQPLPPEHDYVVDADGVRVTSSLADWIRIDQTDRTPETLVPWDTNCFPVSARIVVEVCGACHRSFGGERPEDGVCPDHRTCTYGPEPKLPTAIEGGQ